MGCLRYGSHRTRPFSPRWSLFFINEVFLEHVIVHKSVQDFQIDLRLAMSGF